MTAAPAAALLAALLALTGCSAGSDEPDAAPTTAPVSETPSPSEPASRPRPAPPAPVDDGCYRMSYTQAVAPTSRAEVLPCRRPHTAETFHVGRLDRVVDGRLLAVDARRLQDQMATTCPQLLSEKVGGTLEQRRLSMLRSVWFTPTLAQSDAGADWFRCDAVAVAGDAELLELTGTLAGVLDAEEGRARYGMCGTAEPGTTGFERVACARAHSWRALRTVTFSGEAYPGAGPAQRAGEEPCKAAARAIAPDPLEFRWSYEFPTAEQWAAGQTFGLCWAPV